MAKWHVGGRAERQKYRQNQKADEYAPTHAQLEQSAHYRVSFLYFSRCGMMESCPSRRILSFS